MAESSSRSASHTSSSALVDSILSSYQDRSELGTCPSPIQAMLRNTTETGDLGRFSITPANFPPTFTQYPSRPPRARLRTPSNPHHFPPIDSRALIPYQSYARQSHHQCSRKSSTRTASSEVVSIYRTNTPGARYRPTNEMQNARQGSLSEPQYSYQPYMDNSLRSRSPFSYPTRLKRPGYRPSSPSLIDFNGTDARTYVGMEYASVGNRPPISTTDTRTRGRLSHNSHSGRGVRSSQHGSHLRPPSTHGIHERCARDPEIQWRSQSVRSVQSQQSDMTELTTLGRTPSMGFYYDYSENFGRSFEPSLAASISQSVEPRGLQTNQMDPAARNSSNQLSPSSTSRTVRLETPDASILYRRRRGQLAEWEQLGIESNTHGLRRSPWNLPAEMDGESAMLPTRSSSLGCETAQSRLNNMDGHESHETLDSNRATELDREFQGREGSEQRVSSITSSVSEAEDQRPNPSQLSESGPASTSKPSLEDARHLSLVNTACGDQSGIGSIRVKTHADVPIVSPIPERPLSFRNPDDKLSRILSIESLYDETNNIPRPVGRRTLKDSSPTTKREASDDEKLAPMEEGDITSSLPKPEAMQSKPSFWKLKSYWNDHRLAGEAMPRLSSPFRFQMNGRQKFKDQSRLTSLQGQREVSRELNEDIHEGKKNGQPISLTESFIKPTESQNKFSDEEPIELQAYPAKSNKRSLGSTIRLVRTTSSLKRHDAIRKPKRNGIMLDGGGVSQPSLEGSRSSPIPASAPRILLRPPTPSLGFEDATSLFPETRLGRRSSIPPSRSSNRASQIVDAFVVGSDGSTHRRGSRFRWTDTSFFGNEINTGENNWGENPSELGKVTAGQNLKRWWASQCKGGCFGVKESRQSGSFELYV